MKWILLPLLLLLVSSCGQQMDEQPKLEPYERGPWAGEQMTLSLVQGTVSRGNMPQPVPASLPVEVNRALLTRGQERFNIYCTPCHGNGGFGNGMIVQRGFPPPPSFHTDRLRLVEDRHIYRVITEGYGVMYSYAARVPVADRWAMVAYIRTLQLSQYANQRELPEGMTLPAPELTAAGASEVAR